MKIVLPNRAASVALRVSVASRATRTGTKMIITKWMMKRWIMTSGVQAATLARMRIMIQTMMNMTMKIKEECRVNMKKMRTMMTLMTGRVNMMKTTPAITEADPIATSNFPVVDLVEIGECRAAMVTRVNVVDVVPHVANVVMVPDHNSVDLKIVATRIMVEAITEIAVATANADQVIIMEAAAWDLADGTNQAVVVDGTLAKVIMAA